MVVVWSKFAVRYTDDPSEDFVSDQETEERLDVHETDIIVSLFHDVELRL